MPAPPLSVDRTIWYPALPGDLPAAHEIHIWRASLEISPGRRKDLAGILSRDEVERAQRFHFDRDRDRFIAARGMLRFTLGKYLNEDPGTIRFDYAAFGKPSVSSRSPQAMLSFNLSHSGTFALYAFARQGQVGIDIERVRDDLDIARIAGRFFSNAENRLLGQMAPGSRPALFFQYWTRKEAVLKALGKGVSFPMEEMDVSGLEGGRSTPFRWQKSLESSAAWHVEDLHPAPGYAGAVAAEGGAGTIICRDIIL